MALNSVLKVVTIWLVGFTHLTSGHKNDYKGCITENLSEVGKTIRITNNNNNHQSWVKSLTTLALLDVAYFTPQGTYNIMCTVHFNIPDVWHNFIITLSVDDKNFTIITVLVPELGNNCSKKFTIFHQTLYLTSYNNTVQWTNCTTDNTTVDTTVSTLPSLDTTVSTPPTVDTRVSTPPSTSTRPPQSAYHPLFLAGVVLFFILVVVVSIYVFITLRILNQLLLERGSNSGQEEEVRTYEEWNENWQVQSQL
nr:uncharacterized protein LOC128688927 [Cherax quadricarinatus]